jgi:hypothetical protein
MGRPKEAVADQPKVDYSTWNVNQLKQECRDRGIKCSGRKSELIDRLEYNDNNALDRFGGGMNKLGDKINEGGKQALSDIGDAGQELGRGLGKGFEEVGQAVTRTGRKMQQ